MESLSFTPCSIVQKLDPKFRFIAKLDGFTGRTPPRFLTIVQLVQLDDSVLGLPSPLLPAGPNGLRCLEVDLLVVVLVVQQQQLLDQGEPTLKRTLVQFGNLNN